MPALVFVEVCYSLIGWFAAGTKPLLYYYEHT